MEEQARRMLYARAGSLVEGERLRDLNLILRRTNSLGAKCVQASRQGVCFLNYGPLLSTKLIYDPLELLFRKILDHKLSPSRGMVIYCHFCSKTSTKTLHQLGEITSSVFS